MNICNFIFVNLLFLISKQVGSIEYDQYQHKNKHGPSSRIISSCKAFMNGFSMVSYILIFYQYILI